MTEQELTDSVIDTCHIFGWRVVHFRPARVKSKLGPDRWVTALQGDKGFPDIVAARDGEVIFVELKVGKNRLEPEQREWIDALNPREPDAMHDVFLWTDREWDDNTILEALR